MSFGGRLQLILSLWAESFPFGKVFSVWFADIANRRDKISRLGKICFLQKLLSFLTSVPNWLMHPVLLLSVILSCHVFIFYFYFWICKIFFINCTMSISYKSAFSFFFSTYWTDQWIVFNCFAPFYASKAFAWKDNMSNDLKSQI